ncbi:MAG: 1,2-diacylglycerol 3-glucosyltransferase [Desulfobacterales bacterium CG23_combo_of_CG06-09_8_20_14_all_52_9]|nr:MAG: 1,2-diacylglycerol 3-glucosyltransferase [Desulfobacterales bacterium CG23_combo_of_CG06-09_8_20_14_all_52_9]
MRILVINYEYPPLGGGGGLVTRDILEQMAGLGHKPTVITSGFKGLKSHENVNGVNIIRVPVLFRRKMEVASIPSMLSYFPSSVLHAVRSLNGRMYDIINTHFAIPSGPTGYVLSKIFHLPNILSIHGGDIFDPSKAFSPHKSLLFSTMVKAMLKTADRVVAQSEDTRQNAYKYYRVNRPIEIIPLGIKKSVFCKKTRRDFGLDPDEIVFCTIGRLIKRKNIDDALVILSILQNNHHFKFLIIGEGPEKNHLAKLVQKYGLAGTVRFIGNVSDEEKFQLLAISDIYISTALHEGFGLVFLEAMECGLSIVCYNRGGQNDFLKDGKTGFLIKVGDTNTFSRRIAQLVNSRELRKTVSVFNKQSVKKYYINHCAQKYVSLFQDVIYMNRMTGEKAN